MGWVLDLVALLVVGVLGQRGIVDVAGVDRLLGHFLLDGRLGLLDGLELLELGLELREQLGEVLLDPGAFSLQGQLFEFSDVVLQLLDLISHLFQKNNMRSVQSPIIIPF